MTKDELIEKLTDIVYRLEEHDQIGIYVDIGQDKRIGKDKRHWEYTNNCTQTITILINGGAAHADDHAGRPLKPIALTTKQECNLVQREQIRANGSKDG